MDAADLTLVRWMYPRGVWNGGGIDPRITTADIARHVGLGREAVWSRIRRWKREGFFSSFEVVPNSRLFGVHRYKAEFHASDIVDVERIVAGLESVDGMLSAWSAFGDSMTARTVYTVAFHFVAATPEELESRTRHLRRLAGTRVVNGPYSEQPPPVTALVSRLDWRIIAALRVDPAASLSHTACELGITLKTLVRHRDRLLTARAVTFLPRFNWAVQPGANFALFYERPSDHGAVVRAIENRFPNYLPMTPDPDEIGEYQIGGDFDSGNFVAVRLPARSQIDAQGLVLELSRFPGVTRVYNEVWGPWRFYYRWIEPRIAEKAGALHAARSPTHRGPVEHPRTSLVPMQVGVEEPWSTQVLPTVGARIASGGPQWIPSASGGRDRIPRRASSADRIVARRRTDG